MRAREWGRRVIEVLDRFGKRKEWGILIYKRGKAKLETKNLMAVLWKMFCNNYGLLLDIFLIYSRLLQVPKCSTKYRTSLGLLMGWK